MFKSCHHISKVVQLYIGNRYKDRSNYSFISLQTTDWVDPSFDDFSETAAITAIAASSLGLNNSSHRRKKLPSTVDRSRLLARRRGKLSSSECTYGAEASKEPLSDTEPWVDKYKPETQVRVGYHTTCICHLDG